MNDPQFLADAGIVSFPTDSRWLADWDGAPPESPRETLLRQVADWSATGCRGCTIHSMHIDGLRQMVAREKRRNASLRGVLFVAGAALASCFGIVLAVILDRLTQ